MSSVKRVCIGPTHLLERGGVSAVDEQEQVGADARIEAEVDVQQDGGPEDKHPEGAVEPVALVELGEVVDLEEHPLESHDDDGGEDGLGDNS